MIAPSDKAYIREVGRLIEDPDGDIWGIDWDYEYPSLYTISPVAESVFVAGEPDFSIGFWTYNELRRMIRRDRRYRRHRSSSVEFENDGIE